MQAFLHSPAEVERITSFYPAAEGREALKKRNPSEFVEGTNKAINKDYLLYYKAVLTHMWHMALQCQGKPSQHVMTRGKIP